MPLSCLTTSLRSPELKLEICTCSAREPVWASVVQLQVAVLVPEEPSCQQSGTLLVAVSSDGFLSRLAAEFEMVTFAAPEAVLLPAAS